MESSAVAAKDKRVLRVGHRLQYRPAFLKPTTLRRESQLGWIKNAASSRLNLEIIRTNGNAL